MPGRGDEQKQERAGKGLQRAPATPLAGQDQIRNSRADKEDGSDESLGEGGQSEGCPHGVKAKRPVGLEAGDEAVQGSQQEEAKLGLGNDEAGKEEWTDGSEHAQAGIESGARAPGAARPQPRQPGEPEHGQSVGQVRGKDVLTENAVEAGGKPVGQRRLLNVADAVDLGRDPVAGLGDALRGLGVGGVHIVEQRRVEQGTNLDGAKNCGKQQPGGQHEGCCSGAVVRRVPACGRGIGHCIKNNSGQGSVVRDQWSVVRDQGSGIRDQRSGIRDQ